jgi:hypothetical protein
MAKSRNPYRKVDPRRWTDGRLTGLTPGARLLLVALATSSEISAVGVVPLVPRRWALMTGLSEGAVADALDELQVAGHVAADELTGEVLIVDHVVVDDGVSSPNGVTAVVRALARILSDTLRDHARDIAIAATKPHLRSPLDPTNHHSEAPTEAPPVAPSEATHEGGAALHEPPTMNHEPPTTTPGAPAAAVPTHEPDAIAQRAAELHVTRSTNVTNPGGLRTTKARELRREHPDLLEELSLRDDLTLDRAAELLLAGRRPPPRGAPPDPIFLSSSGQIPQVTPNPDGRRLDDETRALGLRKVAEINARRKPDHALDEVPLAAGGA